MYLLAVGAPIPVVQQKEASSEYVDKLHQQYMTQLNLLFETHKLKYGHKEHDHLEFI